MKRCKSMIATVLLLVFIVTTGTGCIQEVVTSDTAKYGINATLLGINLKNLDDQFDEMEVAIELLQDQSAWFSEEEWNKLQNVSTIKDLVVKEVKKLIDLEAGLITVDSVVYIYNLAKSAYEEGYDVVSAHYEDYDASTKIMLSSFNNKAKNTEERVVELLANPDNQELNESLLLILSILSTAVQVLGTVSTT